MKYYIIAGEASGDLHASFLIQEIKNKDKDAQIHAFGGEMMRHAGANIIKSIKELSFMGFIEVVANLKTVLKNIKVCKQDILSFNPNCVILVDFAGFNMRIAAFCKRHNIKAFYYISPKVWAWNTGRVKKMKNVLSRMFVIFPFEKHFFAKYNFDVEYYGNPLLDEISSYNAKNDIETFLKANNLGSKPIVAILPGSRKQEISRMLSVQARLADKYADFDFVLAAMSSFPKEYYSSIIGDSHVKIVWDSTYSLLNCAYCALVCSGTATLETALFNVPEVVCYKGNPISFAIGKIVVRVKYISLVNLILGKAAVVELLQNDWNEQALEKEFKHIAYDDNYRSQMQMNYSNLKTILGSAGCSEKVAQRMIDLARENN
jgi:lipid-A-disaccharide synthase